jgi:hypothetical protein
MTRRNSRTAACIFLHDGLQTEVGGTGELGAHMTLSALRKQTRQFGLVASFGAISTVQG